MKALVISCREFSKNFAVKESLTKRYKDAMREIKLALLEADVNFKVVKEFVNIVSEKALGQEIMESLTPAQQLVKIVNEELTQMIGGEVSRLEFSQKPPTVIMMCGLQRCR